MPIGIVITILAVLFGTGAIATTNGGTQPTPNVYVGGGPP